MAEVRKGGQAQEGDVLKVHDNEASSYWYRGPGSEKREVNWKKGNPRQGLRIVIPDGARTLYTIPCGSAEAHAHSALTREIKGTPCLLEGYIGVEKASGGGVGQSL